MYKKIACMNIQMGLNGCSHSISARNFRVAVHFERYVHRAGSTRGEMCEKDYHRPNQKSNQKVIKLEEKKNMENWLSFFQSVLIFTATTTVQRMHSIKLILSEGFSYLRVSTRVRTKIDCIFALAAHRFHNEPNNFVFVLDIKICSRWLWFVWHV